MNSPLKFPRRVRIHGGECGAVARALHHEAQKVALTQNEQMFSSDVKGLMRQADRKKSLRSTLIERKQMSTKTSIKRVALVAVSALGFGLLSVAPSSGAAITGSASIGPVRVSMTGATQDAVSAAAVTITQTGAATNAVAAAASGTRLLNTIALTTAPSAAAVLVIAQANVVDGASASLAVTASNTGSTGGVTLAQSQTLTSAATADVITTAAAIAGITFKANVAGTYSGTITTAQVGNGNTLVTPFTFTTTGAPTSFTFTSDLASTAVSGAISATVTLKDANGATTQGSTVDTFKLTASTVDSAGAATTAGTFASSGDITAADLVDGTQSLVYTNSVTASSTSTLTATPQGTLGTLGAKTLTVTTVAASTFATAVATVDLSTTNVVAASGNVAAPSLTAMNAYTMALSQTSFTFKIAGLTPNTSFSWDITDAITLTVNGAAYTSGTDTVAIASATGTYELAVVTTSPAANDTVVLDINTVGGTNIAGQVNATVTYAVPTYAVTLSSPTATDLKVSGSTLTYTGYIADQFGNKLGGATVTATGTNTPVTSPVAITSTGSSNANGEFTLTLTPAAATTSISTVISAVKSGLTNAITSASAHVTNLTATGIAATLTLSDPDTASGSVATDGVGSRTINLAPAVLTANGVAATDSWTAITVATTVPSAIAFSATATNGIRLVTSTPAGAVIPVANTAAVTGTGGTTTIYAIPTKVGAGVITVTSGGLTATYTLTGTLSASAKAQLVTLTAGTNAKGKAAYTVTTTDIFGNVVAADVNISMSGAGYLSNGFKNMTLTTLAADGSNTFDVISDGSAASGITATIVSGSYTAVDAAQALTSGIAASAQSATATVTVTGKSDDTTAAEAAVDAALEAIDAATSAEEAAFEAIAAADAATLAAEEAKAAAEAATTAIEELSSQVATLMAALQAQITTLANTVAKILARLPKK
jgi:hypothetical protein